MGCGGSKPEVNETAKDAAAAEIQGAAAAYMKKKQAADLNAKQDEAAADIQGARASYLAKKRAAAEAAAAPAEDGGLMSGIVGFFSNRAPAAAPAAPAAAPTPATIKEEPAAVVQDV